MASISDAARAWPSSQEDRPGPGRSWLEVPCPAAVRPARGSVQLPDRSHTPPPKHPGWGRARGAYEGRGGARRSPERGAEGWDRREGVCRGHCSRGHRRQSLLGMAVGRGGRAKGLGPRDAGFVRRRPASGRGAEETLVGGRCTGAGARQERGEGAWGGGCAPQPGAGSRLPKGHVDVTAPSARHGRRGTARLRRDGCEEEVSLERGGPCSTASKWGDMRTQARGGWRVTVEAETRRRAPQAGREPERRGAASAAAPRSPPAPPPLF